MTKTSFFTPQSVAVIGASANKKKLGFQLLKNLIDAGYDGQIFPVNLDEKEILAKKVYQSVLDIHAPLDLAVIIIPREIVPQVLKQCIHKLVKYVLIISAGFAEKDAQGKKLQKELDQITKNTATKIIGPNCLGIINTEQKLNLTFAASKVQAGGIGLILQSGAIGAAILDWAREKELGISKFISLGNKLQTNEMDALRILGEDDQTKMIGIYLEEISDPREFLCLARKITKIKPIVVLKGGVTDLGAKAASSHTAALATSNELERALFSQTNVLIAEEYSELLDLLQLLTCKIFDAGKSLAIVTNAGGPGILAADAASRAGFKLPNPNRQDRIKIENTLTSFASISNPFDLGGDAAAESYRKIIELIEKSPNYSSILAIVTPQTSTEIEKTAKVLTKFRQSPKPVVASFLGGQKIKPAQEILTIGHIPHFDDPADAVSLLGKIHRYFDRRKSPSEIIEIPRVENYKSRDEVELLEKYEIPFVKSAHVVTDSETMAFVEENDFPVAFKTNKPIKYKGRSGKVGLNISDNHALNRATGAIGYPAIIQKMVDSPYEILIGARRDPKFGIVVFFGHGGIFVEENVDVKLKMLPLTAADVDEMIEQTSIWKMIKRYKVKTPIKQTILTVARLMDENQDISSIEFNPFKILNGKIVGVDIHIERKNG